MKQTRYPRLTDAAQFLSSVHIAGPHPNVCIISTPRSGSTWLMELILSQPGFKPCNEPFNLRNDAVARRIKLDSWTDLYNSKNLPILESYLRAFLRNSYSAAFKNLRPGNKHYRPITSRIAFKFLHACEHQLDWLNKTLNARGVLLVRHPIPVALSRKELPRLKAFLTSDFSQFLPGDHLQLADDIIRRGDPLEAAILDWCLQNTVPLRHFRDSFVLVCYEQLVLKPDPVLTTLAEHLDLPSVETMRARLDRPSASVSKSGADTMTFFQSTQKPDADKKWLVEKWRPQVTDAQERSLMKIVADFGIDIYKAGDSLPTEQYWL